MDPEVIALLDHVGDVRDFVVVLDFDGTLSPIVDDPDAAALATGAGDAVAELTGITDVAILSGRHLDDLAPRVAGLHVFLLGGHGTEVAHPDGSREPLFDEASRGPALDQLEADLRSAVDEDAGWLVERKPASIALHHRRVDGDEVTDRLPDLRRRMLSAEGDWELLDGKAVTELRPAGVDKGTAMTWLAERFPGRRLLVVGDDVTDEDAFRAARQREGIAVLVADAPRDTAAHHRLPGPAEVVEFLGSLTERIGASG